MLNNSLGSIYQPRWVFPRVYSKKIFKGKEPCSKAIVMPAFWQGKIVYVCTAAKENLDMHGCIKILLVFLQTKKQLWREINV
jgi:hypothetical protein